MSQGEGIVLRCDAAGLVERSLLSPRGVFATSGDPVGKPLAAILDDGSRTKSFALLDQVRTHGTAFDWELDVVTGRGIETMRVTAASTPDGILVAFTDSQGTLLDMISELQASDKNCAKILHSVVESHAERQDPRELLRRLVQINNEITNAQRELAKKNRALKQLDEDKSFLLGMAAHDLRNPLSAILISCEVLLFEKKLFKATHMKLIESILRSATHMRDVIEGVLDLSAIELGKLDLKRVRIDLIPLVEDVLSLSDLHAASKRVVLEPELPDQPVWVSADAVKLKQVVGNLISNAIKYTHEGTRVVVSLREEPGHAVLQVSDEGPGIPEGKIPHLFEPFTRAQPDGDESSLGRGLGLAIAKRVVDGHGGWLTLESSHGRGSIFEVRLPVYDQHAM